MFKGISLFEFSEHFKTEEQCYQYLVAIKWKDGYRCKRCGHAISIKGKREWNRRCQQCEYDESVTAGTLFHKLKFSILKAFHICYRISVSKKGMSTQELSREFTLQQKTCWRFKRKIQAAMKSSEKYLLKGNIDVDELAIGQEEAGEKGRSAGKKKLVIMAVERVKNGIGRMYAQAIEDYSSESFQPFFEKHIAKEAKVRTDKWSGYIPLKAAYPLLTQEKSEKGKNFSEMHILIMNLKSWLRGIHHHCSKEHVQAYLDEFCFRFNRRAFVKTIFHKLMERMMESEPLYLQGVET